MKSGDPLPDEDHVIRHIAYGRQERSFPSDELLGIFPNAFELRPMDNGALSVTWVEYWGSFGPASIISAINRLKKVINKSKVGEPLYAIAMVSSIKKAKPTSTNAIRVVYEPTKNNMAHSVIRRLPTDDAELLDHLATEVFTDLRDGSGSTVAIVKKTLVVDEDESCPF